MALNVLAYNMKRVMAIIGVVRLIEVFAVEPRPAYEINPCSMPQGASRAVRVLIYADWRSVITKLTVALKIGADTEPFSHSLGP